MAIPSKKSSQVIQFLEQTTGRIAAITADKCIVAPFGCGGPAVEFRDNLSRKEYTISGLCQNCQDNIFGLTRST